MYPAKFLRPFLALVATMLLTACAISPVPVTQPDGDPEPASPQSPSSGARPQPLCAWSQLRGIATVLSLSSAMANGSESLATWQFFPGDDIVFHPLPAGADVGDEYKALLRRPMNGPCQPELYLVGPLQGDR